MKLVHLLQEVELRDAPSARKRAWRRLVSTCIGATVGLGAYRLFHPHSAFHWKLVLMALVLIALGNASGVIHDFHRVRHPGKGLGPAWLLMVGLFLAGSALMFWIVTG